MNCGTSQQQGVSNLPEEPIIHIAQLAALSYGPKHRRAARAKVVSTDAFNVSVYLLSPNGGIPAHRHSQSWDVVVVLEGTLRIRSLGADGPEVFLCGPGAIHIVRPDVPHEVENPSEIEDARFLLIQGPSHGFDFLPAPPAFTAKASQSEVK
jgi:quercetin dioxygenase-like cupin family protein